MRRSFSSNSVIFLGVLCAAALAVGIGNRFYHAGPSIVLVDDDAALLTDRERTRIEEFHEFLLLDYGIDYRVATVQGEADLNLTAASRFAALSDSMRSASGRGLLLMVDRKSGFVRMEVGHALEPVFTDAFIKYVETRQMVPFFRSQRLADGILATTELIVAKAREATAQGAFDKRPAPASSGGGGATTGIAAGDTGAKPAASAGTVAPGISPSETLKRYFAAMAAHNGTPDLGIYTPETRTMLTEWVVTRAQMDMVVESYRRCVAERMVQQRGLAVIRYRIEDRQCAPHFFRETGQGWQLDLAVMQDMIRFGRTNAWHFNLSASNPYGFAFEDWAFDANGFPRSAK